MSIEKKSKLKANEWLENKEDFIIKSNFDDKYYLITLARHILNFLRNAPIPILSSYDPVHKSIWFSVGNNSKGFEIDTNVAYFDYLTIIKRWLIQFYPHYELDHIIEEELSVDEVVELKKQATERGELFDVQDALLMKKKKIVKETGIIEKITLKSDEFIFNHDGKKFIRLSGTRYNILPLSTFLENIRSIPIIYMKVYLDQLNIEYPEYDHDIYNLVKARLDKETYANLQLEISEAVKEFIFENSQEVKCLDESHREIFIPYSGKMMVNFFKINYCDLHEYNLVETEPFIYKWGPYKIKFESQTLQNDCINYYKKMKGGC